MQLVALIEILVRTFSEILSAEELHPTGHGDEKRERVLAYVAPELTRPRSSEIGTLGDIEELLEVVGRIVDLVVKLLNMVGVFTTTAEAPAPADPETEA